MKIEVGKTYWNGFGCKITIVAAPTAKCRWYEDHIGYHYVATDGLLHKIGMTCDPDTRWRHITSPRRGKRPALVTFWHRPFDASYIEMLVKRNLKPMRYRQNTTEWFSVPRDVMIATVSDVIQRHGDDKPDYL